MNAQTLYDKLWSSHIVREEEDGTVLLYIDRHLVHEVTSPQAFEGLKLAGRPLWRIDSVVSTADHNTPTDHWDEGIKDPISKLQVDTLDHNIKEFKRGSCQRRVRALRQRGGAPRQEPVDAQDHRLCR